MDKNKTKLLDSLGYLWTYHHAEHILKLDDDETPDGGYHLESLDEAKQFLEENY